MLLSKKKFVLTDGMENGSCNLELKNGDCTNFSNGVDHSTSNISLVFSVKDKGKEAEFISALKPFQVCQHNALGYKESCIFIIIRVLKLVQLCMVQLFLDLRPSPILYYVVECQANHLTSPLGTGYQYYTFGKSAFQDQARIQVRVLCGLCLYR